MKKRILAGALSLVMLFSLMPASVLAAENDVPDSAPASACAQLEDCGGGVHAVDCPLYAAPAGPSEAAENGASEEEGTACGALPGCVGEAHDPECPLYVEPQEKPAEEIVQTAEETVPAEENVIYVSQTGSKNADGTSVDAATTLAHATELANAGNEAVTIKVIGSVSVEDWKSPTVDTTIVGQDEQSELLFEYCAAGEHSANIDMQGPLTIDQIKLNVHYTKPGLISIMPSTGTFTIVANGKPLEITAQAEYIYDVNRTNAAHVIGGSLGQDLEGDTNIKICTALPVTYVVGGCYDGTLTGNTNIWMEDSTVQYVIGGGEADNKDSTINGSTNVTALRTDVKNNMCGGGSAGRDPGQNANVTGNTEIYFENTKSGRVRVYGGGISSDEDCTATVGGDVSIISVSNDMSNNDGTVYGGGFGDRDNMDNAKVFGNISIKVKDGYSFGHVYGGGYYAHVGGNVSIEVTGGNEKNSPYVYGGGEGHKSKGNAVVGKDVSIKLDGVKNDVYALGKYSSVVGKVTIELASGGASKDSTTSLQRIYNYDKQYVPGTIPNDSAVPNENTEIVVTGDFTASKIYGAPLITIQKDGALHEHTTVDTSYDKRDPVQIFAKKADGTPTVASIVVEQGGTLDLLQTNEISGSFSGAGVLTMPKAAELVAGGPVTVQDGAMYVPTDGYQKGDVFLRSKAAFTQGGQPEFAVNEGGTQDGYFTQNRAVSDGTALHEWYVERLFLLKPLELTKYMAGDHDHEKDENCFPDPRFEEIDNTTAIMVGGEVWDKDANHGRYPFQIIYYPLPENYDLEQFPKGLTDADFEAPLADDHDAGTYIARVEPNDGIKLTDITINGSKVKTELSLLHIREVEKVDQVGDDIGKLASQVMPEAPTQKVTEAVAVTGPEVEYLVNNIEGQKLNPNPDVRLLHDELLTEPGQDSYTDALIDRLEQEGVTKDSTRKYAMKYLDLIDANDSNLLVCAQSGYQIYIPYPAGTDQSTKFALYHFSGLNRTYTAQDYGENVFENIKNSKVTQCIIEKKPEGIVFTVNPPPEDQRDNYSIGAMALTWQQKQYTVTFDSNGGTQVPDQIVTEGQKAVEPTAPTRGGYDFEGWYLGDKKYDFNSPVTGSITLTAHWSRHGGGGTTYYTLSYDSNGGTEYKDERYRRNTVVKLDKEPTRKGYTFTGWYADRKLTDEITSIKMTGDKTVYAGWRHDYAPDGLNSEDHVAYVAGYPDGTVRPDSPVTRAETATMLYRLLTDARRNEIATEVNSFSDVSSTDWFVRMVSTMANGGYLDGYPDGTFGGNRPITRAEFVTMLVRFIGLEDRACSFPDVSRDHWAYEFIATATNAGWIAGYTDGTFGPDRTITRAEAMTILNSVLNRGVNEKSELLNFKVWPDNPESAWYYYEIIEASNAHEYTGSRPSEDWTRILKDRL